MIRTMFDTDNLAVLNQPCHILATYSDLLPHPSELPFDLNGRTLVLIDRGLGDPSGLATIWDVEAGALRVDQLAAKYDAKHARGEKFLTVYSDRSHMDAVKAAMGDRDYWSWVATLDGTVHIPGRPPLRGPAAVQCLDAGMVGLHGDLSLVMSESWNPTHAKDRARDLTAGVDADLHKVMNTLSHTLTNVHFLAQRIDQMA